MFVLPNSMTMLPRFLAGGVLTLTVGLLPQGVLWSQDFVALERRLGAAVAEGEIDLRQAQAMMDALRATSKRGDQASLKMRLEERMKVYAEALRKQVAEGEISKDEAIEMYEAAGQKIEAHYREAVASGQSAERDGPLRIDHERAGHSRDEGSAHKHQSDEETRDLEVNQQLRKAVEQRLRYHGEILREKVAKGELSREDMEKEYKATQRRILEDAKNAELRRRRGMESSAAEPASKNDELKELRREIEARIRQNGERLRQQFAVGGISREEMEEQYLAGERKMLKYYRQAELKMSRERKDGSLGDATEQKDDESEKKDD